MRRLALIVLLIAGSLSAQELRTEGRGEWSRLSVDPVCIGGATCTERRLRLPLEDKPVIAIQFRAHDGIGNRQEGALRLKIDGNTVRDAIDIPRRGETFNIDVDELRGRYLLFEPARYDEVEISDVAVLYGREMRRRRSDPPGDDRGDRGDRAPGGWRAYPGAAGCIGGDTCSRNGDRITIALDRGPVVGVRFHAHDQIGQRADGRLKLRIDETTVAPYIDVQRAGRLHEIDVDGVSGMKLVIETISRDEVEIKDVEVLYGRTLRGDRSPMARTETAHEGGCIGGTECGGVRARIRVPIFGRPVGSIRFYARDDIGARAGGVLRIRIDDQLIESSLDIPREGRTFTIDGKALEGDYLIIEPASDDEVEIKDVRVRFAP